MPTVVTYCRFVEFRVLGSVDLLDDAGPVPLGGPRQRLLLAALLAARGHVVSIDSLTDGRWVATIR